MECHDRVLIRRDQRGQSAVELALAFPVLLLILMGILDFGRAYFAYVSITNAAREGARYGVQNLTVLQLIGGQPTRVLNRSGIDTTVQNELAGSGISVSNSQIGIACAVAGSNTFNEDCTTAVDGDQLLVTVGPYGNQLPGISPYNFALLTTGILPFGNSIPMSNYTIMAITSGEF